MTTFDRFDPFERRIGAAMDDIAGTRPLDYLDDVFRQTARTAQRPRWSFPERWFNVDLAVLPVRPARRLPIRAGLLVALAALLALVGLVAYVGSQQHSLLLGPADNGLIAYSADGDIYIRDSPAAPARLVIDAEIEARSPVFSPDGRHLAYVETEADGRDYLKVTGPDGAIARQVLVDALDNAGIAWRPDGTAIAVDSGPQDGRYLVIVQAIGSGFALVDLGGLQPSSVSWSPDGTRLVFRGDRPGGSADLYVVNADGTGLQPLALGSNTPYGPTWGFGGPVWSPDGRSIAYSTPDLIEGPVVSRAALRVHLANADGTGQRVLGGSADSTVQEAWPRYSPDGTWILLQRWYLVQDSATPEAWLAVLPADGSVPAQDVGPRIRGGEAAGMRATWSPDGTRILMAADNLDDSVVSAQAFSIDPVTGAYELLPWTTELPDWQRVPR